MFPDSVADSNPMTPQQFVLKWKKANLSERSAAQQHFIDLCHVLEQPTPAEADPEGNEYTFERGATKQDGGNGWADVWKRDCFGWEYKGKHKDLSAAYQQLLKYRESLDNPPLLVVCDLDRFEIHTNFTGTAKQVYRFNLDEFDKAENLNVLRRLFTDPESLKPTKSTERITEEASKQIGKLAESMWVRGVPAEQAAHFLMKCMFCMFAEDIRLLPEKLFSKLLTNSKLDPDRLAKQMGGLFTAMAHGTDFGADEILHFNGGLFADGAVEKLTIAEIQYLIDANIHDWADVEPTIFGTLFERMLDPKKRSQIGAHYTSTQDILTLLEPVVMVPLRREWAEVQAQCLSLWPKIQEESRKQSMAGKAAPKKASKPRAQFDRLVKEFAHRVAHVKILDPACGSGNFLFTAIRLLLDLEKEVYRFASQYGVALLPQVRPTQLAGIEINRYAQELAQVVIWIGYLQWKRHNGFAIPRNPVLDPIDSIRCMDAILEFSATGQPKEPTWPEADFVVGNPPFLGSTQLVERGIPPEYVAALTDVYQLPGKSDLCCYWFEHSRRFLKRHGKSRIGLLATQSIRHGGSREVLDKISSDMTIFFAESDREWINEGASVRVSMIAFQNERDNQLPVLDGREVTAINSDLSSGVDITKAFSLHSNQGLAFEGDQKGGPFDATWDIIGPMMLLANPSGRPNSDVIVPRMNGDLLVKKRGPESWIVDFGTNPDLDISASYEAPFEFIKRAFAEHGSANSLGRKFWWIHKCPRPKLRSAIAQFDRFVVTPRVSKHRVFCFLDKPILPDSRLFAFAFQSHWQLGVLHSRLHEQWTLRQGARHGVGNDPTYNVAVCFESFPFPKLTSDSQARIETAAIDLIETRDKWLNPPEWTREEILEFPGSNDGPWKRYVHNPDPRGIGTVRYPRLVAVDEGAAKQLAKRTLTNLYNQRPTWLDLAHRRLDEAVFAAYGWPSDLSDDQILERLLKLNLEREPAK